MIDILKNAGFDPLIAKKIGELLRMQGFVNIKTPRVSLPVGPWRGEIGKMMMDDLVSHRNYVLMCLKPELISFFEHRLFMINLGPCIYVSDFANVILLQLEGSLGAVSLIYFKVRPYPLN